MIVIKGDLTVWFDIDDTCVLWNPTPEQLERDGVDFECPSSLRLLDDELKECPSWTATLVPHKVHIEQIKKHKMRGHRVILWSAGGSDWCEAVAKALNLEDFVDLCISKPTWIYDDLPASEFMPKNQWMKDE